MQLKIMASALLLSFVPAHAYAQDASANATTGNVTVNNIDIGQAGAAAIHHYYEEQRRLREINDRRRKTKSVTYCTVTHERNRKGELTGRVVRKCA